MNADAVKAMVKPEEDSEEVSDDERLKLDIDLFAYDEEKLYTDLRIIERIDIDFNMSDSDDQEESSQRGRIVKFREQFDGDYRARFFHYLVPTTLVKDISKVDFADTTSTVQFILRDQELTMQHQQFI